MQTPNFTEVRGEVARLAAAEDVSGAVWEYIGDPKTAPHRALKIGQYALLVQPVTDGLRAFLDDDWPIGKVSTPNELIREFQVRISNTFDRILPLSPNFSLIQIIHNARYMQHAYGAARFRFNETFQAAISFSAATMYEAACANAATIMAEDPTLTDPLDIYGAIIQSVQLPLAETRLHFDFLVGHIAAKVRDATNESNPESLYYDRENRVAKLARPLPAWTEQPTLPMRGSSVVDPRIGCPVSFAPDLVIDYYQRVAQEQCIQGIWDPIIRPRMTFNGIM